jgi:hypothetical protein
MRTSLTPSPQLPHPSEIFITQGDQQSTPSARQFGPEEACATCPAQEPADRLAQSGALGIPPESAPARSSKRWFIAQPVYPSRQRDVLDDMIAVLIVTTRTSCLLRLGRSKPVPKLGARLTLNLHQCTLSWCHCHLAYGAKHHRYRDGHDKQLRASVAR